MTHRLRNPDTYFVIGGYAGAVLYALCIVIPLAPVLEDAGGRNLPRAASLLAQLITL